MVVIKKLTIDDFPLIAELIPDKPQRLGFGRTSVSRDEYLNFTERILRSPSHQTWGYFEDDEFISFMSSFDFPNLPYYSMVNFKVLKSFNFFKVDKSGFSLLTDKIVQEKEKEGRYVWYVVRAVRRKVDSRKRVGAEFIKYSPDLHKKYITTIDEYIPANQPSKFELFNRALLRDRIFNDDLIVLVHTCKAEFRKNIMPDEVEKVSLEIENLVRNSFV